jgi:hypothetical protein
VTISHAQRDAIYQMVITHLTGIGDGWLGVHRRDFADAKRLGRKFAEDLQLLEDLGWSETIDRETVTLTMPPASLRARLLCLRPPTIARRRVPPRDASTRFSTGLTAVRNTGAMWRQLFLGLLGYPGDGKLPERGWLRWATIALYGALFLVIGGIALVLLVS